MKLFIAHVSIIDLLLLHFCYCFKNELFGMCSYFVRCVRSLHDFLYEKFTFQGFIMF